MVSKAMISDNIKMAAATGFKGEIMFFGNINIFEPMIMIS